jgi:chorismate mutase|tara:strand:+ start:511 stop:801 length:291 start_codon:yes stop_codon:yes gene_type:complete
MSPKNKIKLNKLRKRLDILDSGLLNVIKKRSYLVNEVLKLKNYKNEIIDKKRINFILKKIRKKSIEKKVDPKITNRIWKSMIWSFVDYEKRNFKKK